MPPETHKSTRGKAASVCQSRVPKMGPSKQANWSLEVRVNPLSANYKSGRWVLATIGQRRKSSPVGIVGVRSIVNASGIGTPSLIAVHAGRW